MANYRTIALIDAETATTPATKIVDLDLSEVISRITIEYIATNNTSTPTAHAATIISKIEIVDGSDVLFSLSGKEAQALDILTTEDTEYLTADFQNDVMTKPCFYINFGRYLYDPVLALDPKRFRNLQLKITHSVGTGGSSPDAGTLSVFLDLFDDKKVSPIGFLQSKEIYTYTVAASASEYVDLPTDMIVRAYMIQGLYTAKHPWDQFNKIKLYEDEGKKVIIDEIKTSDLYKYTPNNRIVTERIRINATTTATTNYCLCAEDVSIMWSPNLGTDSGWLGLTSYGGTFTADVSADTNGDCLVTGRMPHGCLLIPMGQLDDYTDWETPMGLKSLKMKITAGSSASSSGTNQIVIQQLRKY